MKRSLIGALVLLGTVSAMADAKTQAQNTTEEKVDIKKYSRVVVDESAANREGKKYTVSAQIMGFNFTGGETALNLGYFLNDKTVLKLRFSSLRGTAQDIYSDEGDSKEVKDAWAKQGNGTAIMAGVKLFTGNSFYVEPAAYYRNQYQVYSTTEFGASTVEIDDADIKDAGLSLRIGNQWQWDNFTIGCDWIGISRSLVDLGSTGDTNSDRLASTSLLNLYLGASF